MPATRSGAKYCAAGAADRTEPPARSGEASDDEFASTVEVGASAPPGNAAYDVKLRIVREKAALRKLNNELSLTMNPDDGECDRRAVKEIKDAMSDRELVIDELMLSLENLSRWEAASSTPVEQRSPVDAGIQKLLARQIIDGKLPEFDGNPLQWRAFRSRYDATSTQLCLSAIENMYRLQSALRGAAKQHVGHLLHEPDNLQEAMEMLERRFGDRLLTLRHAVQCLDAVPRPEFSKPKTLVDFAAALGRVWTTLGGADDDHTMLKVEEKLPPELSAQWKMYCRMTNRPSNFSALHEWFMQLADDAWRSLSLSGAAMKPPTTDSRTAGRNHVHVVRTQQLRQKACFACKGAGHFASNCEQLMKMTVEERLERVRRNNLCMNCLCPGHQSDECRKPAACAVVGCSARHHSLLHAVDRPSTNCLRPSVDYGHAPVLPINVSGPYGTVSTYAFVDSGSCVTFVDKSIAAVVGAFGPTRDVIMDGYFNKEQHVQATVVNIAVSASGGGPQYELEKALATDVPLGVMTVDAESVRRDFEFAKDVPLVSFAVQPKVLIGSAHSFVTESLEVVARHAGEPRFYRCRLGWYMMGPRTIISANPACCFVQTLPTGDDLHDDIRKNILQDDIGVRERPRRLAVEEESAMTILRDTIKRTSPTSVEVGLLWRNDNVCLPDNYRSAVLRLEILERKMAADALFSEAVRSKFSEYQEKGYMTKTNYVYGHKKSPRDWYIPIFAVLNKNKPGKIRLVADCKAETQGVSLNKMLLSGPDLNNTIVGTLLRFRRYEYAASADVEEMFHRVFIRPADRCAQRILWRDGDRSRPADVYEFNVMTFGATCSPTSAQFAKNWNAEQYQNEYPEAAVAIQRQFYVDDYLDSFPTIAEAASTVKDVIYVQSRVRMRMTRWISNYPEVLKDIPEGICSPKPDKLVSGGESSFVLGLKWCRANDVLLVTTRVPDFASGPSDEMPTKRQVLAKVMAVYDPLGLASYVSARGKILLRDVWSTGIGWDERLPENLREKWRHFYNARRALDDLPIPRSYSRLNIRAARRELHTFCDASESAYAAAVYLRTELYGAVDCRLVYAKNRVAPMKPVSIPRLELQAAVLGVRIADYVKDEMELSFSRCFYWSDSTTALAWIKSETRKFAVYISNRVGEILDRTSPTDWHWVSTTDNPADFGTRCVPFSQEIGMWLKGPTFLQGLEEHWPTQRGLPPPNDGHVHVLTIANGKHTPNFDVTRFSKLESLLRVTACVLRLNGTRGTFTIAELDQALMYQVRLAQNESFSDELDRVERARAAKGKLKRVEVYLDDGYLRVRTRLTHAEHLSAETRFPYVLDGKHPFTMLLIDQLHRRRGHQGKETIKNDLRQRFYVVGASSAVKAVSRRCAFCLLKRSLPSQPRMGDLPDVRLNRNVHPFQFTGLDYFGPFFVKLGRRREKRWGAIFTCLSVRAVHLEIASSLSADSALQAIQRMSNRRGAPQFIYCDNGTNFHGAETELRLMREQTASIAEARGIQFVHVPPYAPHMAGVWERMVRSVKTTLSGLMLEHVLTDETAHTVFSEVEWTLNSRPLTPVSGDPDDDLPLTPNHFLLNWRSGASGQLLHPRETFVMENADLYRRRQWKTAQRVADLFWDRWAKGYLTSIASRTKWTRDSPPVAEGDVVLLTEAGAPRNEWRRGLVVKTFPGKDGIVRVVDLRTEKGILRRPVTRLCRVATKKA